MIAHLSVTAKWPFAASPPPLPPPKKIFLIINEKQYGVVLVISKLLSSDSASNIFKPLTFKPGMMIELTNCIVSYQFEWPWPSFKITIVWRLCTHFLTNFSINLDDMWYATMTCWSVQAFATFFAWLIFIGENLHDFIKNMVTWHICLYGMHSDAFEPNSFKLGTMIDLHSTFLNQFQWPWPSLNVSGLWEC